MTDYFTSSSYVCAGQTWRSDAGVVLKIHAVAVSINPNVCSMLDVERVGGLRGPMRWDKFADLIYRTKLTLVGATRD